jgi:hypothetical protein
MRYLLLIVLALLSGLPVAVEESDIPFLPENLQVITAEFAWGMLAALHFEAVHD